MIAREDLFASLKLSDFYRNVQHGLEYIQNIEDMPSMKVALHVRNQADYIESTFIQKIHLGRHASFEDHIGGKLPTHLSWYRVVSDFANVVGRENILVRPFESIKKIGEQAFVEDFFRSLGFSAGVPAGVDKVQHGAGGENRSFSTLAIEMARRVNPLLAPHERRVFRRFLQEHFSTATHERASLLGTDRRREIQEMYAEDNLALFREYMPHFDPVEFGYVGSGQ